MSFTSLLFALFASFTLIHANGNLPGSCTSDGTQIDPAGTVPGGGVYTSYCPTGYGRPQGVCNCITGLNSCLATLAGCPGAEQATFVPTIPSTIYVGKAYEFRITMNFTSFAALCFLRPLPAGLAWIQVSDGTTPGEAIYAISGTPSESMPKADYGVAAARGQALGGISALFSFEIQSCSLDEAVYPSSSTPAPTTPAPTPSTPAPTPSTPAPTAVPIAASTAALPTTCTATQNGNTRCTGSSTYQTCDHGVWQSNQMCSSGLVCKASNAQQIYCDRP